MSRFKYLEITAICLFLFSGVQAGVGDYAPARFGIDADSHPYGTVNSIEFNRFTDNTVLGYMRGQIDSSDFEIGKAQAVENGLLSYLDEREFIAAGIKGKKLYEHDLQNVRLGDVVRLQLYVHNNARQLCGAGNRAKNVEIGLDWTNPRKVVAAISADNATPQKIFDTVDIALPEGTGLELVDLFYRKRLSSDGTKSGFCDGDRNLSYSDRIQPAVAQTGKTLSAQLNDIPGSYGGNHFVYIDLKVITQLNGYEIYKSSNPVPETEVLPGGQIRYNLRVVNTGAEALQQVMLADAIDHDLEFVSGDAGVSVDVHGLVRLDFGAVETEKTLSFLTQIKPDVVKGKRICNQASATVLYHPGRLSNEICHTVSDEMYGGVCGNGTLENGEGCDDGNLVSGDGCTSLCQVEGPNGEICGNGKKEGIEQCDDGNLVSGDGCSAQCQAEGGDNGGGSGGPGGGGADSNPTVGTCSVSQTGAPYCLARYPVRNTNDADYLAYEACRKTYSKSEKDCLIEWAAAKEFVLCGTDTGAGIEVPVIGALGQSLVDSQCLSLPPILPTACENISNCPNCFGGATATFIDKKVGTKGGDWQESTHIAKGELVPYKIALTLGRADIYSQKVLAAKVRFYDFVIPSASGHLWNRQGLTGGWNWVAGGRYFERSLSGTEINALNNGGGTVLELKYEMDSQLGIHEDIAELKNTAFAVVTYEYIDQVCVDAAMSAHFAGGAVGAFDRSAAEVFCTQSKDLAIGDDRLCGVPVSMMEQYSTASLGDQATVQLVRPYIEAKAGGDAGVGVGAVLGERLTGDKQVLNPGNGFNTSGRFLIPDSDTDGFFDLGVSEVEGDRFFESLARELGFDQVQEQNISQTKSFFGQNFKTDPAQSGVYWLDSGTVTLPETLDLLGENRTFVIKNGTVKIPTDVRIENGFAAFVVQSGTIEIGTEVESIEGAFVIQNGEFRSRNFVDISKPISEKQLKVSGLFIGDVFPLLQNRLYIGTDPDTKLEPNVEFLYDVRMVEATPPELNLFLGEGWRQDP